MRCSGNRRNGAAAFKTRNEEGPGCPGPLSRSSAQPRSVVVVIVAMMIGIVSVVVVAMAGHLVADHRAADPSDDRADRSANRRARDRAGDAAAHRACFVGKRWRGSRA